MDELVAVFGSSGFVGRNLMSFFLQNDIEFEEIYLRNLDWKESLKSKQVTTMINLVGKAHDHEQITSKTEYFDVNLGLTKQIFLEFLKSNSTLFIHISSLAALEEIESQEPLSESADCRPISFYGCSKRAAEEWLLNQNLPDGKKLIIIRPPMIHGPGDKGNLRLLYKFVSKGIPYPLASFDNRRSFIGVDNFCFYLHNIIRNQHKLESGIYHIADDDNVSTKEIIHIIEKVKGRSIIMIPVPPIFIRGLAKLGDIFHLPLNTKRLKKMTSNLLLSNKKIKERLGLTSLLLTAKEGLEKTIKSMND